MSKRPLTRREKTLLVALKRASNWIDNASPGRDDSLVSWAEMHDYLVGVILSHYPKWTPGDDA